MRDLHLFRILGYILLSQLFVFVPPLVPNSPLWLVQGSSSPTRTFLVSCHNSLFLSSIKTRQCISTWASTVLAKNVATLQIHNIPWYQPPAPYSQTRGSRSKLLSIRHWVNLGIAPTTSTLTLMDIGPHAQRNIAVLQASERHIQADQNAPYTVEDCCWDQMGPLLNKTQLPDDWSLAHVRHLDNDDYIQQTYHWVQMHYNSTKALHQLALIAAIVISKMAPNVFSGISKTLTCCYCNF